MGQRRAIETSLPQARRALARMQAMLITSIQDP